MVDNYGLSAILQYVRLSELDDFDELFYYDGKLGPLYQKEKTTFKVWAPTALEVMVKVGNEAYQMERKEKGVFEVTIQGDLDNQEYNYLIRHHKSFHETLDLYAYASNANSNSNIVIDVDKMVSWHAGASRMDAGLQITEQLAKIAQAHKANSKDRNLIIFVAASSLPYQNGVGVQNLRPEAAQAAAQKLKDDYGATIFGFGDFRPLTLQSGMSSEEQRTQFNETMAGICGNSNTLMAHPISRA